MGRSYHIDITNSNINSKRPSPKISSRNARQLAIIDTHVSEWRKIIGGSAKNYCIGLYHSAVALDSDEAIDFLSEAHTTIDQVQSRITTALNCILEVAGTSCDAYREGELKLGPVKQCVSAVFDLWEAATEIEDIDAYPVPLERIFARSGFTFQRWEEAGTACII